MRYNSTRGGAKGLTFEQALLSGYQSDGGILLPETIPRIPLETLQKWAKLSYPDLVKTIVPYFVDAEEISPEDIPGIIDRAMAKFSDPNVLKIQELKNDLNILEMFHGPTLAFKDLALTCVGQFLAYILEKRKKHVTIIVGTSGDTGSAAIEGVRGLKGVDMIVLLPKGRCSRIQELQMTTAIAENIHIFRVDGTSDDLDVPIKAVFMDEALSQKHNLCCINSINWARILVQIPFYFYAYFQMRPDCDGPVEMVVPTGACGNVTSGCIAHQMGLPIKLTCAVNDNDIIDRTLTNGDFSQSDCIKPTLAPAMDIMVPYNVERILYLFSGADVKMISEHLEQFERSGKTNIPQPVLQKMQALIGSCRVDQQEIRAAMKQCWQENQYLVCPHTSTAVHYHYRQRERDNGQVLVPRVCFATASPAKFEEAVLSAGLTPQPTAAVLALRDKPTNFTDMNEGEDWEGMLRAKIEEIHVRISA